MESIKLLKELESLRLTRNNISNLDISLQEKEILRKSLNYYENMLYLDITRNNNNLEEFMEHDIESNNQYVSIPKDDNVLKYQEYVKIDDCKETEIINNLINDLITIDIDKDSIVIILKSLKEYSLYLEQVDRMQKSNKEIYKEVIGTKGK
ncbi:MAG: hypothetical protein IKN63_05885 [Bacilli bacterium]|nr:hypothetical protein [Bacilli bacterium]